MKQIKKKVRLLLIIVVIGAATYLVFLKQSSVEGPVTQEEGAVFTISNYGAYCRPPCDTKTVFYSDGTAKELDYENKILRQGLADKSSIENIKQVMEDTNYKQERSMKSDSSLISIDGGATSWIFHTLHGDERISNAEVKINEQGKLFQAVSAVLISIRWDREDEEYER